MHMAGMNSLLCVHGAPTFVKQLPAFAHLSPFVVGHLFAAVRRAVSGVRVCGQVSD